VAVIFFFWMCSVLYVNNCPKKARKKMRVEWMGIVSPPCLFFPHFRFMLPYFSFWVIILIPNL